MTTPNIRDVQSVSNFACKRHITLLLLLDALTHLGLAQIP
jgi:hypothetical protein